MIENFPQELINAFRERHALLWLCQRYEIEPDQPLHSFDQDPSEVRLLYRNQISELDRRIADVFWEAIWTDSIKGLVSTAIKNKNDNSPQSSIRRSVILAADPDQEGQLDTRQLLPIYFINGILDYPEEDGRYDGLATLRRFSYRTNSLRKIEDYPSRSLVVIGAQNEQDINPLFDAISSFAPIGLKVYVLWPEGNEKIKIPDKVKIPVFSLSGTIENLLDILQKLEVPKAGFLPKYTLRTPSGTVTLDETELFGITDYFNIIFENDLIRPNPKLVTRQVLEDFINGAENNWKGYAAELGYKRIYEPIAHTGKDLAQFIQAELLNLQSQNEISNLSMTIPAQGGSGITTLIRQAAFKIASVGYPVLLLKQDQVTFDFEAVAAFLNQLQQKAEKNLPVVIFFDSNHEFIPETYGIAQLLSVRGRLAVVVRVENPFDEAYSSTPMDKDKKDTTLHIRGRQQRLQKVKNHVTPDELTNIHKHFENIALRYPLSIDVPELDEWIKYQEAQRFSTQNIDEPAESLFWVTLHFFLFSRDQPPQGFDNWIKRVYEALPTKKARELIRRIAVFSSFRLITPLIPLLRSLGYDGSFSNEIIDLLRDLDEKTNLITWDAHLETLEDQALRFKHPLIAQKLLSITDNSIAAYPIEIVWPVVSSLKGGGKSDVWLAENLAFQILRTERRPGSNIPFLNLRLETFRKIPPQISEYNKAILHHWARALNHAAIERQGETDTDTYLQDAIDKIERAISLPPKPDHDEHPGHLYTTLGTIYYEVYKRQSLEQKKFTNIEKIWSRSEDCFKKAMGLVPDSYPTLAAYSSRLLERANGLKEDKTKEAVNIALEALSLLEQAEDVAGSSSELDEDERYYLQDLRTKAWDIINPNTSEQIINDFTAKGEEIGFLLQARKEMGHIQNLDTPRSKADVQITEKAIKILSDFMNMPQHIGTWRTPHLLYRLYNLHPKLHYDFSEKLLILRKLERTDYKWHIRMRFDYAVLCYQNDQFPEGERRFREIRSILRQPNQPAKPFKDYLRLPNQGDKPRIAVMTVRRRDSEWRGYCFVQEIGQEIPFRPRHFDIPPKTGDYRNCIIRFETNGPIAVPTSFSLE